MKSMMESVLYLRPFASNGKLGVGRTKLGLILFGAALLDGMGGGQLSANMPGLSTAVEFGSHILAPWLVIAGIRDKGGK